MTDVSQQPQQLLLGIRRDRRWQAIAKPIWLAMTIVLGIAFTALSIKEGYKLAQVERQIVEETQKLKQISGELEKKKQKLDSTENQLKDRQFVVDIAKQPRAAKVEYFSRNIDMGRIEAALRELGFKVDITAPRINASQTNALYYGSGVRADELKIVALALIKVRVQLNIIQTIEKRKDPNLIEIGANRPARNYPPLTEATIQAITDASLRERRTFGGPA